MIPNKMVKIGKVYQYDNIECDIILGNDFLKQFSIYQQTIYTIMFKIVKPGKILIFLKNGENNKIAEMVQGSLKIF